jgi:dTDP-glucose pyrophosphorylase
MNPNKRINERVILLDKSLLHALKIMDLTGFRSLLVLEANKKFAGILSIGDIQRAIIKNISLSSEISYVLRKNPRIADDSLSIDQIKQEMFRFRMEFIPVIDKNRRIKEVYFWDELFSEKNLPPLKHFDLPIVIMAGGIGSRLRPLTHIIPKPLFPIGEHSIIEEIFDRFSNYGSRNFHISLNYKAELIEYYLKMQNLPYNIEFHKEIKPLGTAGSLSMLKDKIKGTFFVSNCDILIDQDYSEILDYHLENKNNITIVAALKHYPIPYGVLETGEDGDLQGLQEKPEITFKINSGMYILESSVLEEIPDNTFLHITQLINKIHDKGWKVGVFPVSEKSWKDIGTWDEYKHQLL